MRRVDQAVTAAHQYIVDTSQRTGAWWARQIVILTVICAVARWAMYANISTVATAILLLCGIGGYFCTSWPELFYASTRFGNALRKLWLVLAAVDIALLAVGIQTPPGTMVSVCITAYQYFATCKPPRPRPPVTKLATQGGAA